MRVLLVDQFGEIGGAQRGLLEAAAGFAERGWTLDAAVPEGPLHQKLAPLARVTALPCGPFRSVRKSAADAARFAAQFARQAGILRHIVESRGIDVLYVNGPRAAPAAAWGRAGRPLIFHAHSVVTQPVAVALTGQALRTSGARVLASSHFAGRWLEPYARVQVIYNGIAGWGAEPVVRASFTRVGVLGRIAPEKGQLTFVRAARIAVDQAPHLRFVVGGGPVLADRGYYDQVRSASGGETLFVPWMDDVREFFDRVDLLVVPSDAVDANPRVIPEAFAAGVPVLTFDAGGVEELVDDGVTGMVLREHSAEALAGAIVSAVENPDALRALVPRAYAAWKARA